MITQILNDYSQHLKLERGFSPNSISAYIRDIREFFGKQSTNNPKKVLPVNVNQFIDSLIKSGRKPATIARKISSLRQFFIFLGEIDNKQKNPVAPLATPRIVRYHPDYLSPKEIEKIINAIEVKTYAGKRDLAIIELLYGSGLRISELINLSISDIEFQASFIRILGKGNKQRLVPLGGFAKTALEKYLETKEGYKAVKNSNYVFHNKIGKKYSRVGMWKIIKKLVAQTDINKNVTPHTFRHSFATHMLDGGADLRIVQEILGHADISTTQIYTTIDRNYIIAEHKKYHPRELAGSGNK